jgi:hypothetical protein
LNNKAQTAANEWHLSLDFGPGTENLYRKKKINILWNSCNISDIETFFGETNIKIAI